MFDCRVWTATPAVGTISGINPLSEAPRPCTHGVGLRLSCVGALRPPRPVGNIREVAGSVFALFVVA